MIFQTIAQTTNPPVHIKENSVRRQLLMLDEDGSINLFTKGDAVRKDKEIDTLANAIQKLSTDKQNPVAASANIDDLILDMSNVNMASFNSLELEDLGLSEDIINQCYQLQQLYVALEAIRDKCDFINHQIISKDLVKQALKEKLNKNITNPDDVINEFLHLLGDFHNRNYLDNANGVAFLFAEEGKLNIFRIRANMMYMLDLVKNEITESNLVKTLTKNVIQYKKSLSAQGPKPSVDDTLLVTECHKLIQEGIKSCLEHEILQVHKATYKSDFEYRSTDLSALANPNYEIARAAMDAEREAKRRAAQKASIEAARRRTTNNSDNRDRDRDPLPQYANFRSNNNGAAFNSSSNANNNVGSSNSNSNANDMANAYRY